MIRVKDDPISLSAKKRVRLPRDETRRSRFGAERRSDRAGGYPADSRMEQSDVRDDEAKRFCAGEERLPNGPDLHQRKAQQSGFALETTSDGAEWMCAGRRTKRSEIHEEEATTWID